MRAALLFVFFAATVSAWDHFEFDMTLFCNYPDRETYNIQAKWWEVDSIAAEDEISKQLTTKIKTGRYSFTMEGALDGDEMLSAGYKPKLYLTHDCTSDRKAVVMQLTITTLCEIGHPCHYRIIRDITNDWGKYEAAADAFKFEMTPFPDFP